MAKDEEYEIMPHRTIKKIKKEIDSLKKKSKSAEEIASPAFKKSMDNLTVSMNSLMELFKEAAEDMKIEDRTQENINEKLGPLVEKVSEIEEENKRIAEGIVVIADMVKELKQKLESRPAPRPMMPPVKPRGLPALRKPPIHPSMTGKSIEPRHEAPIPGPMPPRHEAMPPRGMPPPGPLPPRGMSGPAPPRPPSFTDSPGMPMPPMPPEGKKKKGLFGLFKK